MYIQWSSFEINLAKLAAKQIDKGASVSSQTLFLYLLFAKYENLPYRSWDSIRSKIYRLRKN